MNKQLAIIDANAVLYRAFYSRSPELTSPSGEPTKVVNEFFQLLFRLLDANLDYVAVAFDAPRETLFRTKLFPAYKGQRPPKPKGFGRQRKRVKELLRIMQVPTLMQPGYEADDLIATLVKNVVWSDLEITIVSNDKDLYTLAGYPMVRVLSLQTNSVLSKEFLERKYGIELSQLTDYFSMVGDTADNVKGALGIGEKGAVALLTKFKTANRALLCKSLLSDVERIGLLSPAFKLARQLIPLRYDAPISCVRQTYSVKNIKLHRAAGLFKELGFKRWANFGKGF